MCILESEPLDATYTKNDLDLLNTTITRYEDNEVNFPEPILLKKPIVDDEISTAETIDTTAATVDSNEDKFMILNESSSSDSIQTENELNLLEDLIKTNNIKELKTGNIYFFKG